MEEVFEEWCAYARRKKLENRDVDINRIISDSRFKLAGITGIRRSGKSSLLMLIYQKLMDEGKRTAYVNLEDSRIKDEKDVLDSILKWFGDEGYLLLDEITYAQDWEGWLARNHEMLKGKLRVIITSSRKKLAEPSKPLRGRIFIHELYPLSFREFLTFRDVKLENTTSGMGRIERALKEYLVYGGFPEVVLTRDKTDKIRILNSYFRDIIGLDVAEMANETPAVVETFGKYVLETPRFSASKCLNFFKSLGYKIGKESILNLEKHSENGYLFFFVPIFSHTIKDRLQYPRKAYAGDTGFLRAITGRLDRGRLLENAVFLELKRRREPQTSIYYWKNRQNLEVDFVLVRGSRVENIVQVAYEFDSEKTRSREIKGLIACAKEFSLRRGMIITSNTENEMRYEGIRIRSIPFWKWVLTP